MKLVLLVLFSLAISVTAEAKHKVTMSSDLVKYLASASMEEALNCGDEVEYKQSNCDADFDVMGCASACPIPTRYKSVRWKVVCDSPTAKKRVLEIDTKYSFNEKTTVTRKDFTASQNNSAALVLGSFFNPKDVFESDIYGGSSTEFSVLNPDGSSRSIGAREVKGTLEAFNSNGRSAGEVGIKMKVSNEVPGIARILSFSLCGAPMLELVQVVRQK